MFTKLTYYGSSGSLFALIIDIGSFSLSLFLDCSLALTADLRSRVVVKLVYYPAAYGWPCTTTFFYYEVPVTSPPTVSIVIIFAFASLFSLSPPVYWICEVITWTLDSVRVFAIWSNVLSPPWLFFCRNVASNDFLFILFSKLISAFLTLRDLAFEFYYVPIETASFVLLISYEFSSVILCISS